MAVVQATSLATRVPEMQASYNLCLADACDRLLEPAWRSLDLTAGCFMGTRDSTGTWLKHEENDGLLKLKPKP